MKLEDTENEGNLIGGPLTSITGKLVSFPELILYLKGLSVVVDGLHEANLKVKLEIVDNLKNSTTFDKNLKVHY